MDPEGNPKKKEIYIVILASFSYLPLSIVAWLASGAWVRSSWENAYFINHRYDGMQLRQIQDAPGVHQLVWLSNFITLFLLYPSTFNLLEVAAVDKPEMHLWETGIMRITRHPQMVGQVIWCLAHAIWIGNSVAFAASIGLIGHHLFGIWNGDRRLAVRHGEAFEVVKKHHPVCSYPRWPPKITTKNSFDCPICPSRR